MTPFALCFVALCFVRHFLTLVRYQFTRRGGGFALFDFYARYDVRLGQDAQFP